MTSKACEDCGEVVQVPTLQTRYCRPCAALRRRKTRRDSAKRLYNKSEVAACEICGEITTLCRDHDHSCCERPLGQFHGSYVWCGDCFRGMLCKPCNLGIANFKESPEAMEAAIRYVVKWQAMEECKAFLTG